MLLRLTRPQFTHVALPGGNPCVSRDAARYALSLTCTVTRVALANVLMGGGIRRWKLSTFQTVCLGMYPFVYVAQHLQQVLEASVNGRRCQQVTHYPQSVNWRHVRSR